MMLGDARTLTMQDEGQMFVFKYSWMIHGRSGNVEVVNGAQISMEGTNKNSFAF